MYLYQHDATGRIVEVLAVDENAQHVVYDNAGRTLASWHGPHLVNKLKEVAYTLPHCIPAGACWRRAGEVIGPDGRDLWRWERVWTPINMPANGKGNRR